MAVRGSKTSRPMMKALDVLGRRWCLRILWELRPGPLNFRSLREACDDVSPSSLSARLADLRELGVIESSDAGYLLTRAGRELGEVLVALDRWADAHARKGKARR